MKTQPIKMGLIFVTLVWCTVVMSGEPFEAAESLFRQDERWLGSDGAASAVLGKGQIFWSFEDTFVATSERHRRGESVMVRNTIAIQQGANPLTASMRFYWGTDDAGLPESFFPDDGDAWYWTGGALRLEEGPLIVFLARTVSIHRVRASGFVMTAMRWPSSINPTKLSRIGQFVSCPDLGCPLMPCRQRHWSGRVNMSLGWHYVRRVPMPAAWFAIGPKIWRMETCRERIGGLEKSKDGRRPKRPRQRAQLCLLMMRETKAPSIGTRRMGAYVHIATYGFGAATIGSASLPELTGPWSPSKNDLPPPGTGRSKYHDLLSHGAPGPGCAGSPPAHHHLRDQQP